MDCRVGLRPPRNDGSWEGCRDAPGRMQARTFLPDQPPRGETGAGRRAGREVATPSRRALLLPFLPPLREPLGDALQRRLYVGQGVGVGNPQIAFSFRPEGSPGDRGRSEERRVGKECRWW